MTVADRVAARADQRFEDAITALAGYLAVPAISCEPAHHDDVRRLAIAVRDDLEAAGLQRARLLELDGALPCVAAEWMAAGADAPTVLIYGHLDLQPVKGEPWTTPPHQATRKGDRLYARGAGDDMGGWVSHLHAIRAWLTETGALPCNVRLLIEGEEEIGSPNLARFMDAFPDAFEADVMVLTDCDNPSTEVPGLTISLRGLMEVIVTCEATEADVHSGLWGNMVPDVSIALARLIARITDEDGRLAVARMEVPEALRRRAVEIPTELIRKGAHLVDGVDPLPARDRSPAEWLWWQPAVTVVATTLPTPDIKKNALRQKASATLSVRLAPGQHIDSVYTAIERELTRDPPGGVKVSVSRGEWASEGWLYAPEGPAFEAADRAYRKGWGHPLVPIGVGGSIPFVKLFADRYGDLPLILNGVLDPESTAHGPNESLHLGVFRKAIAANVHLLAELGALGKGGL